MGTNEVKTPKERLKETMHLIKQIQELGIHDSEPGFVEVRAKLTQWVKSEEKTVKEFVFDFVRYGRKATLTLPWRADKACEFRMKAY